MNLLRRALCLSGATYLATGCVAPHTFVLAQAVGPPPGKVSANAGQGNLVVYSAWDGLDTGDADHEKHSSYAILSGEGVLIKRVPNRCGSFGGNPQTVNLPPGAYQLEARASNFGVVSIPILIEPNQETVVRLDGSMDTKGLEGSAGDLVRLPNGQPVGWGAGKDGRLPRR